ncbi:hypothetical protein MKX03_033029 [Papaver bracteatum]|nr:hypothetical protein MKX03_033029 [Papaver bracteatum]
MSEEDSFRFSSSYLKDFKNNGTGRVRVVVDWTIGYETCDEVSTKVTSNACGPYTVCIPGNNDTPGYRCNCKSGYAENPYLPYGDANTTGYCQETVKCNDNSVSGCSIPLSLLLLRLLRVKALLSLKLTRFFLVSSTCLSLSVLLITSFVLRI